MFTVIETSIFIQYAKERWADDGRIALINWIATNPFAGDVIPNSGGCRKVHWAKQGMGKRGGSSVIDYNQLEAGWQDWFIDCLCKS